MTQEKQDIMKETKVFSWTFEDFYKKMKKSLGWSKDRDLNTNQKKAVQYGEGPLWIIAGPGSGKTEVLVWRCLKLILVDNINPGSIIITTFTEKAAKNLINRISLYLSKLISKNFIDVYDIDSSLIRIGTLHSLCNDIMLQYRYEEYQNVRLMDDIENILFIKKNCRKIINDKTGKYKELYEFFEIREHDNAIIKSRNINTLFERLIDDVINIDLLRNSNKSPLLQLVEIYEDYLQKLKEKKRMDFSHLQKTFLDFLKTQKGKDFISGVEEKSFLPVKYILVDEYQDTNPIQEKIYFRMTQMIEENKSKPNLNVVGDDDQSMYRFRGASVDAIVNFGNMCLNIFNIESKKIQLKDNYRSHPNIVDWFNKYLRYFSDFQNFRAPNKDDMIPKMRISDFSEDHDWNPIFIVKDKLRECAKVIAEIIVNLRDKKIVKDLSEIAILMRSVREGPNSAGPIIDALKDKAIPYYNPRARNVQDSEEVLELFGILSNILDPIDSDGNLMIYSDKKDKKNPFSSEIYYLKCMNSSLDLIQENNSIKDLIEKIREDISNEINERLEFFNNVKIQNLLNNQLDFNSFTKKEQKEINNNLSFDSTNKIWKKKLYLKTTVRDIFYKLINNKYFSKKIDDPISGPHIAIISGLLDSFSSINNDTLKISANDDRLSRNIIQNFLYDFFNLINIDGLNEFEDQDYSIVPGHVQIMTIHQSKGLEFPFVFLKHDSKEPVPELYHRLEDIFYDFKDDELISRIPNEITRKQRTMHDRIRLMYVGQSRPILGLFFFGTGDSLNSKNSKNAIESWARTLGYDEKNNPRSDKNWLDNNRIPYYGN